MSKLSEEKTKELNTRIKYCLDRQDLINDWEREFLYSIKLSIAKFENLTWPQQKTLSKIYVKIIEKQG